MAKKLKKGQKVTFDHHESEGRWSRRKGIVLAVVDGPMTKDGASWLISGSKIKPRALCKLFYGFSRKPIGYTVKAEQILPRKHLALQKSQYLFTEQASVVRSLVRAHSVSLLLSPRF